MTLADIMDVFMKQFNSFLLTLSQVSKMALLQILFIMLLFVVAAESKSIGNFSS